MAEFCLDCWNKIMGSNDPPGKYIISRALDLCEECGELKPVIIRVKWRYIAAEWFCAQIGYFAKGTRVYLKTVNTPKQQVFSRCAAPFFLAIHKVFLRKNDLHIEKIPGCWSYFQFSDRP